ncbi:MAG: GNAT family N-acetyltransferase [Oscillospiraceae bacterium]|nr:GNAT family N-acetyltransferase [Oscillospiraceae bacterium]
MSEQTHLYAENDHLSQNDGVKGIFSPVHAHAATDNNAKIYERLYQAAADKWVKAGARSHAIALYAHEDLSLRLFFRYGFGMRCVDAIREIIHISTQPRSTFTVSELNENQFPAMHTMYTMLQQHLHSSPIFCGGSSASAPVLIEDFMEKNVRQQARYFAAYNKDIPIAYLKISPHGENFVSDAPEVMNICGAYCLPEYRGTGVFEHILDAVQDVLFADGYIRLGVDFESYNPTAWGFWNKHFTPYTYSVVRQIDEAIVNVL